MGLLDILTQVVNSGTVGDRHVDPVVQKAPTSVLAAGLASAFRSDQTSGT